MMNQFIPNTPGVKSTFNTVLDSFHPNLDQSFLPFPTRIVTLADGENFTQGAADPNTFIEAGIGSVITFTGGNGNPGEVNATTVSGESFEIVAAGITHTHTNDAVIVAQYDNGWRALATSTSVIDADLANLPITAQQDSLSAATLLQAATWIPAERVRYFRTVWHAQRSGYEFLLDSGTLGASRPFAPTTTFNNVGQQMQLQPDHVHINRAIVPNGTASTEILFNLVNFTPFASDSDTRAAVVTIMAGHSAGDRIITFGGLPAGMSWAAGASPIEVMKTQAGLTMWNVPFFRIHQIGTEIFFDPYVLSPS